MQAAEIRFGNGIDDRSRRGAEDFFKNALSIRAGNGVHGVELHGKVGFEKLFQRFKVENPFEHFDIVLNRVDDFNRHVLQFLNADFAKVDVGCFENLIFADGLRVSVDGIGNRCRNLTAGFVGILHAEIVVDAARVVGSGEDKGAVGFVLEQNVGTGRR